MNTDSGHQMSGSIEAIATSAESSRECPNSKWQYLCVSVFIYGCVSCFPE